MGGRRRKMQKKNKHSQDDELKNDCETTAPSNVTATEKLNQNHEANLSAQSEVTVMEKSNQNHEAKPSAQSEVTVTEKLNHNHEIGPSGQSEVNVTEKLNQSHEIGPSAQSDVTVTEKSKQNHETKPSPQSDVTETEKLNQNHETKHSTQSEVTATEKLSQYHETKASAQTEVTVTEKLNQNHEIRPSAQSEVTVTEKSKQNHVTKPSAQSDVTETEKLNQNHETKHSTQSEVTATEKLSQYHETKASAQTEVTVTEKLNQNHEIRPSAQSEVTATEKFNQNHETNPSAQSEVTVTEKSKQNHESKPSALSEVTAMQKLNQDHKTESSAQSEVTTTETLNQDRDTKTTAQSEVSVQSEVTAIETLNQNHEIKPSAQSEVNYTDWQIDEKIKNIRKNLRELQARKAQLQVNHDICTHSTDFLLFHILLSQEKEKEIKRLYDAEAQLQKANSDIKDKEEEINNLTARLHDVEAQLQQANTDIIEKEEEKNKFVKEKEEEIFILKTKLHEAKAQLQQANTDIKDKEEEKNQLNKEKAEEINHLTTRLHDVETQLQKANSDIKEKEDDVKKIYEENKYLTGKLNDAEANLLNITELKVNLEKEIIDLTVQNKLLREKVDRDNELLSRILEYVAENTNESILSPGNILLEEKTHPLSGPGSPTITKIASILFGLRNKLECLEEEKKDLKDSKLLNLKENDLFCQINNSVMNINTTIQNQESINEMFTANDESFNNAVEELRLFLPNKTEQYDLVIKELKLIFETRITSILDKIRDLRTSSIFESRLKNTTIHAEDIDELTQKYNGLTLNINENVEQLRDVPSTSKEPKNKKKCTREEPTGNGSVKRRIKEVSVDSAPTGHLRHKGANSKPMLDYDIEGHRMFYYAKMENDVLLASSTEEISKTNPIAVTPIQNIGTFDKPANTDKKLIHMKIVVSASCDGDIPVETTGRVQRMEEELRDAKARENKLREQLNEYKNPALVDKTKIVRKKRQVQHDQRRPYHP